MSHLKEVRRNIKALVIIIALTFSSAIMNAQPMMMGEPIRISVHASPLISWYRSDNTLVVNTGSRPGFNVGLDVTRNFSRNYAFTVGIGITNVGGKLATQDSIGLKLSNKEKVINQEVPAGSVVKYGMTYLTFPVGLKLQTSPIGYYTIFTNIGFDPMICVGGKISIPEKRVERQNAISEVRRLNFGYHIQAGVEYELGGGTAVILGVGYQNNFCDCTKDNKDCKQPIDRITQHLITTQIGLLF